MGSNVSCSLITVLKIVRRDVCHDRGPVLDWGLREGFSKEQHLSWKDSQDTGRRRVGDTSEKMEGSRLRKNGTDSAERDQYS